MRDFEECTDIEVSAFNPENFLAEQCNTQSNYYDDLVNVSQLDDAICNEQQ
jgi:hypothetical protein